MRYSRFEQARLIGARALQLAMGAPGPLGGSGDALEIAFLEYAAGMSPLNVKRVTDAPD